MNQITDNHERLKQLLKEFLAVKGYKYHYKTNSATRRNSTVVDRGLLLSEFRMYGLKHGHSELKGFFPDILRIWKMAEAQRYLEQLRQSLSFKNQNDLIEKWCMAVTGENNPITIAVTKHFLWQVKRKLHGMSVDHHMLLCLFGPSGAGKSVAIHKLLDPVSQFKMDSDFSILQDKFIGKTFERNFVLFMDEMGGAKNCDVDRLKNIITAPFIESRAMRSEEIQSVKNNTTLIAASNNEIRELIKDPTSSRRYFQIDSQEVINWELINSIDYLSLWQSVDHEAVSPITSLLKEIRVIQESKIRVKCPIEQFLEECVAVSPFSKNSPNTNQVYSSFVSFMDLQGIKIYPTLQEFSKSIVSKGAKLGMSIENRRTRRGTCWPFKLGPT
ncbi:primase-helicase family protein [Halobacteriovorax sp. DA5]|uniref:primase-helicase family protein n=1 Tax=Halobacteriovorax sp. DA5 TaxID=2067553 RepID=UPI000CD0CB9E|nr:primase-helicase family protein [Halobacteriovorax sp. DA5]POB13859.1 hypothetical protein C0Z22_07305 [Halobacteriovorax sp. DA5]